MSSLRPGRDPAIDNLRTLGVLLVLPFHALALFSTLPYHLHEPERWSGADEVMLFIHIWHMPLLFLLAGASASFALDSRPTRRFLLERLLRLGVPLVFGVVALVPPMIYFERRSAGIADRWSPTDFEGSFLEFYPQFFDCCYPASNFSYHHLWFISYLLAFSLLLWPLWRLLSGPAGRRLAAGFLPSPAAAWRLLLLGLPLVVSEMLLRPLFGRTYAIYSDWASNANFVLVLLLGGWIFSQPPLLAALGRIVWPALGLAALLTAALFLSGEGDATAVLDLESGLWGAAEWCWLVALVGLGRRFLARRIPFLTDFAPLSLAFYVLHHTVLIAFAYYLIDWQASVLVKFLALLLLAGATTYALCRLAELSPLTRFLLGLRLKERDAPVLV